MAAKTAQTRAMGYVRVSTKVQAEGYSPEVQESLIKSHCDKEGWQLLDVQRDSETGHSVTRKGYSKALEAVKARAVDVIVVHAFDRWGRDGAEWLTRANELDRLGVKIFSITEGLSEPGLMRYVRAGMGEEESRKIARRVLKTRERAARKGTHCGPTPYGYKRRYLEPATYERSPEVVLVPDKEEAEAVRCIFRHFADSPGMTMRQLALWANREPGICPPRGKGTWSTRTLMYLLTNPVYIGKVAFNKRQCGRFERANKEDAFVVDGKHEPIVPARLWDAAQAKLETVRRPGVRRSRDGSLPFASGLLVCPKCGGRMTRARRNEPSGRQPAYVCSSFRMGQTNCGSGFIVCPVAHAALLDQVKRLQWHPWKRVTEIGLLPEGKDAEKKAVLIRRLAHWRTMFYEHRTMADALDPNDDEASEAARQMARILYDRIRTAEQQVEELGGEEGVNMDRVKKLHHSLRTLDADLQAEAAGDDALRKLLEPLVSEARILNRVPERRTTWASAVVEWTDDVRLLLNVGALSLGPNVLFPGTSCREAD